MSNDTTRDKIALIHAHERRSEWPDAQDFYAADAIIAALSSVIKPLAWEKSECYKAFVSGDMVVQHEHDEKGKGTWTFGLMDNQLISEHPTSDEAKAAANNHYCAACLLPFGIVLS